MQFRYAVAAALMTIATGAAAEDDCRLQQVASLPMTLQDGQIVVDAAIAEHPLRLIVDTGGTTLLRESVAKAIGLKPDMLKNSQYASVFGGVRIRRYAVVSDFGLGPLRSGHVSILVMPDSARQDWQADGLLGGNVLRTYDVDFDFARGKLNLFLPHRCPGRAAYWAQGDSTVAKVPVEISGGHIRVPVQLDGKQVKAILDTGAAVTVLDQETYMPIFGLMPQSPGVEEYRVAGDAKPRYAYTFKALSFGGVLVNKPRVRFISQDYSNSRDYNMLLGTNVLRLLHVYIAYREKMLYVTAAATH